MADVTNKYNILNQNTMNNVKRRKPWDELNSKYQSVRLNNSSLYLSILKKKVDQEEDKNKR